MRGITCNAYCQNSFVGVVTVWGQGLSDGITTKKAKMFLLQWLYEGTVFSKHFIVYLIAFIEVGR
jgi:hypothetical protein